MLRTYSKRAAVQFITIDDVQFELTRKRVKNINLRISRDGRVLVSAPTRVALSYICDFVSSKSDWILAQQKRIQIESKARGPCFENGAHHYLWGQALILERTQTKRPKCVLLDNRLYLGSPTLNVDEQSLRATLDRWYREQIKNSVSQLLEKWQAAVGVEVSDWGIKKMRTKWGTCNTQAARIWLNLELVKYPVECLEYVIVHELTHLIERYHNQRFYRIVESHLPDWRERETLLENFFQRQTYVVEP